MGGEADILFFVLLFKEPFMWLELPVLIAILGIVYGYKNIAMTILLSFLILVYNIFLWLSWFRKLYRPLFIFMTVVIGLVMIGLSGYLINKYSKTSETTTTTTTSPNPSIH